jgi:hypothetical protein
MDINQPVPLIFAGVCVLHGYLLPDPGAGVEQVASKVRFFAGDSDNPDDLVREEPRRSEIVSLHRAPGRKIAPPRRRTAQAGAPTSPWATRTLRMSSRSRCTARRVRPWNSAGHESRPPLYAARPSVRGAEEVGAHSMKLLAAAHLQHARIPTCDSRPVFAAADLRGSVLQSPLGDDGDEPGAAILCGLPTSPPPRLARLARPCTQGLTHIGAGRFELPTSSPPD